MPWGNMASSWETDRKNYFHKRFFSLLPPYLIWLGLLFEIMKYVNYIRRMTNVAISDVNSMLVQNDKVGIVQRVDILQSYSASER